MSAHPRRPEGAARPIILALTVSDEADLDVDPSRPEPRLVTTLDIPPSGFALHLEIAWFPPAHETRLRLRPDERLVRGPGGWVGVATVEERPAASPGP